MTNFFFKHILDPFDYELVAVVANDARIHSVNDLQGTRLCHSGHGLTSRYSNILANVS